MQFDWRQRKWVGQAEAGETAGAGPPGAPAPGEKFLGPGQLGFLGWAATFFAACGVIVVVYHLFGLVGTLLGRLEGVIWPLFIAGVLALLLHPVVRLLEALWLPRILGITLLYLAGVAIVGLGLFNFVPPLLGQAERLWMALPGWITNLRDWFAASFPAMVDFLNGLFGEEAVARGLEDLSKSLPGADQIAPQALGRAGDAVSGFLAGAAATLIIPVYLFFFLLVRRDLVHDLEEQLVFLRPNVRHDVIFLVREFFNYLISFFRGQLIIGFLGGTVYATVFYFAGLEYGLLLGLSIGLLNLVPFLGTVVGLLVALPLAYFQPAGGLTLLLTVGGTFGVWGFLEGNIVGPRVQGSRVGLHPVAIILSFFVWGNLLGAPLGLVLAIPLTAFLVAAWRLVKCQYLEPLQRGAPREPTSGAADPPPS